MNLALDNKNTSNQGLECLLLHRGCKNYQLVLLEAKKTKKVCERGQVLCFAMTADDRLSAPVRVHDTELWEQ